MKKHIAPVILVIMTSLFLVVTTAWGMEKVVKDDREGWKNFDQFVLSTMKKYHVPGAIVVIVKDDRVVFLKGFGVRKAGEPALIDENTRFQVASVSKLFTATALGALVDEGKLEWDRPIVEYIPEFALYDSYAGKNSTCRDMLAHRSGLRAYDGDILSRLEYNPKEMLHRVRYLKPGSTFRERAQYSNIGFFIAGEVAGRVINSTWEEALISRILKPLDMNRSGPYYEDVFKDDNYARGHEWTDDKILEMKLDRCVPAGGQVSSTGTDLAKWMIMLLNDGKYKGKQVLQPATVQEIFSPSMLTGGKSGPHDDISGANGLGCNSCHYLSQYVVEKNGALNGVRSLVTLLPGKRMGIAVVCNLTLNSFPEAVTAEFVERVVGPSGQDLQLKIEKSQVMWKKLAERPRPPEKSFPPSRKPEEFAGIYESKLYGKLNIERQNNKLTLKLGPNEYKGKLSHWTDNTYLLEFHNVDDQTGTITFTLSPDGKVSGIESDTFGDFIRVEEK